MLDTCFVVLSAPLGRQRSFLLAASIPILWMVLQSYIFLCIRHKLIVHICRVCIPYTPSPSLIQHMDLGNSSMAAGGLVLIFAISGLVLASVADDHTLASTSLEILGPTTGLEELIFTAIIITTEVLILVNSEEEPVLVEQVGVDTTNLVSIQKKDMLG